LAFLLYFLLHAFLDRFTLYLIVLSIRPLLTFMFRFYFFQSFSFSLFLLSVPLFFKYQMLENWEKSALEAMAAQQAAEDNDEVEEEAAAAAAEDFATAMSGNTVSEHMKRVKELCSTIESKRFEIESLDRQEQEALVLVSLESLNIRELEAKHATLQDDLTKKSSIVRAAQNKRKLSSYELAKTAIRHKELELELARHQEASSEVIAALEEELPALRSAKSRAMQECRQLLKSRKENNKRRQSTASAASKKAAAAEAGAAGGASSQPASPLSLDGGGGGSGVASPYGNGSGGADSVSGDTDMPAPMLGAHLGGRRRSSFNNAAAMAAAAAAGGGGGAVMGRRTSFTNPPTTTASSSASSPPSSPLLPGLLSLSVTTERQPFEASPVDSSPSPPYSDASPLSPLSAGGGGGGGGGGQHQFNLLSSRSGSIGDGTNGGGGSSAWGSFAGSFTESAAGDTAEDEEAREVFAFELPDKFGGLVSNRLVLKDDAWRVLDQLRGEIDTLRGRVRSLGEKPHC
jgi:hypothetical protein